jgi:hypothetical protein
VQVPHPKLAMLCLLSPLNHVRLSVACGACRWWRLAAGPAAPAAWRGPALVRAQHPHTGGL